MLTVWLWLSIALNLTAFGYHVMLIRRRRRHRRDEAVALAAAADVVRSAGRGDYFDGRLADLIADDLAAAAYRATLDGMTLRQLRSLLKTATAERPHP